MEFDIPFPKNVQLINLRLDEASKIVGTATERPFERIQCTLFNEESGEILASLNMSPFAAAEKDDQQSLREITAAMATHDGTYISQTVIYEFDPKNL